MPSHLSALYPSLTKDLTESVSNAICPFKLKLPLELKADIHKTCDEFLKFKKAASSAWEDSILNSLDFHYSDQKLKIIEANTNASGYLISHLCYAPESHPEGAIHSFEQKLFESFKYKFRDDFDKIYIFDAHPESEKMFPEFLMYKDFFNRFGVDAVILTTEQFKKSLSATTYAYNRDTDFHFDKHPELLRAWKEKNLLLSSSPLSYSNIAAKNVTEKELHLLKTEEFSHLNSRFLETLEFSLELWDKRKSYFFKPSSSFGSKGVYSGKSVSRKKFDSLNEEQDYLAQELHPPGKVTHGDQEWKFDIRAYFSEGAVQKILARVYRGQLTNFSQAGGGFALIDWIG